MTGSIVDADLYAEDLIGKRIDSHVGLLADADAANFGFGNIDADVDLVAFKQRGDGRIRGDEVAGADIENFNDSGGGRGDLALAVAGLIVVVCRLGEVDVFTAG